MRNHMGYGQKSNGSEINDYFDKPFRHQPGSSGAPYT